MRGQGFFVVMNHVINPVIAGVLRSPLHGAASRHLLLLTLRTRRSGRRTRGRTALRWTNAAAGSRKPHEVTEAVRELAAVPAQGPAECSFHGKARL